jgi:hypothetical protein
MSNGGIVKGPVRLLPIDQGWCIFRFTQNSRQIEGIHTARG